ncbi:YaaA family protein [Mycoplasma anserisalpingitidis]|uniref:YaaA family protein n=1 Tax=Mycoplasma anserisalpingitidis TaxID=519450 RepID=UPI0011B1AAAF|nr:YaaA family protein [Mycoplasma anserisalpingitidis]QDY87417.1 YaaA family protein [Mycoplasma anserisalpingitidis]
MKILISPAKNFTYFAVSEKEFSLPIFHSKSKLIEKLINELTDQEFIEVYKIKENKIEQYRAYSSIENKENLLAINSFNGIQYKYLDYSSLTEQQKSFINQNVLILSSLYGIISPLNRIKEYKIDFNNKLNLYHFWDDQISHFFNTNKDEKYLILSSNEYTKLIQNHLKNSQYISVKFVEEIKGKLVSKSTMSKIQRGKMLRWIAQNNINDFEQIKNYTLDNFEFFMQNNNELIFKQKNN